MYLHHKYTSNQQTKHVRVKVTLCISRKLYTCASRRQQWGVCFGKKGKGGRKDTTDTTRGKPYRCMRSRRGHGYVWVGEIAGQDTWPHKGAGWCTFSFPRPSHLIFRPIMPVAFITYVQGNYILLDFFSPHHKVHTHQLNLGANMWQTGLHCLLNNHYSSQIHFSWRYMKLVVLFEYKTQAALRDLGQITS